MALMLIMDWNHIVFIWKGIGWFNFRSGWLNKIQEINVIYQNRTDYSYLKQYFQRCNIAMSHFYNFFNIFSALHSKVYRQKKFKLEFQSELVIRDILLVPVEFSTLFWLKMMNLRRNVCISGTLIITLGQN